VALAVPNIDAVVSSELSLSFLGWMTTVTWTFLEEANLRNSATAMFWTAYRSREAWWEAPSMN
jgi:hypothetical protein